MCFLSIKIDNFILWINPRHLFLRLIIADLYFITKSKKIYVAISKWILIFLMLYTHLLHRKCKLPTRWFIITIFLLRSIQIYNFYILKTNVKTNRKESTCTLFAATYCIIYRILCSKCNFGNAIYFQFF